MISDESNKPVPVDIDKQFLKYFSISGVNDTIKFSLKDECHPNEVTAKNERIGNNRICISGDATISSNYIDFRLRTNDFIPDYFINKISYIDEYDNSINDISNNSGKVITVSGSQKIKHERDYFTQKM